MEIGNFHNSNSNSLCDCVFYLSKSLTVIAYIFYAVFLKDIVNLTLMFAFFFFFFSSVFRKKFNIINIYLGQILYWNILSSLMSNIWYCKCLRQVSGDFIKVSLLTAYNSIHKFDIICLSEMYLNSKTLSNDENLNVPGYNLIRTDHLSNTNRGGVCIYFKESLLLRLHMLVTSINASALKLWF